MMQTYYQNSLLFGSNAPFVEELYERYLSKPQSIPDGWRAYFDTLPKDHVAGEELAHTPIRDAFVELAKKSALPSVIQHDSLTWDLMQKQIAVLRLISAYRVLGARRADLDPLQRMDQSPVVELDPSHHGLTERDMDQSFGVGSLVGSKRLKLSEIIERLRQIYCGTIGLEYMYITRSDEKHWIRERFESSLSRPEFDAEKKIAILKQITAAETLERYLHTKYVGQKRFSLEGGESLIAALDHLIQNASQVGVQEIIVGMAHRGRLNVLVNTLGKLPRDLFAEFEGRPAMELASGDVKYHMGFSSDISTSHRPVHVTLAFNPSHLEIVNPVVEGSVRARQDRRQSELAKEQVIPVLIHGDAAFTGLGVNQGTFNFSQTRGHRTGGTLHIVVNNQIGFTTSDPRDMRSTLYCTDVAKMIEAPIFHVNGDDPEAVCYVMQAALDFRMKFKKDVVIDLVCFRKLGHNEGDDPFLTQPMMYKKIVEHPGVRTKYASRLIEAGVLTQEQTDTLIQAYRDALDRGEHVEQTTLSDHRHEHAQDWSQFLGTYWEDGTQTGVARADLEKLADRLTYTPDGFKLHRTVGRLLESRRAMVRGEQAVDWGMAESLAYASLLTSGYAVRFSGEDSGRGTFSHRHAVFHDQNRERWDQGVYIPLQHLSEQQARFTIIDSILNEEAVLAFEYGYACSAPKDLVIWEAQFGDFSNGAQVAIDQFIVSGETKWGRLSGLTLILPHGYDGQGPEHSSARLERWLQLCAEHNIQVVIPSTAAQMFHVLRRQVIRPYRKPLIIFMSKKLLRYKASMSPVEDLTQGTFRVVIPNHADYDPKGVERVILCAGQVYYDLLQACQEKSLEQRVAIVRLEQLYPFPTQVLSEMLAYYPQAKDILWVQEEPRNQGAWYQIRHRLEGLLAAKQTLEFAGRPSSASPAVGYMSKHLAQLRTFLDEAFML